MKIYNFLLFTGGFFFENNVFTFKIVKKVKKSSTFCETANHAFLSKKLTKSTLLTTKLQLIELKLYMFKYSIS